MITEWKEIITGQDRNQINLLGRITDDPILKMTKNFKKLCNFTVAIKRHGTEHVDFIPCVIYGKLAENLQKYVHKGTRLSITGRLITDSYEKTTTGDKITTFQVEVERIEFLN